MRFASTMCRYLVRALFALVVLAAGAGCGGGEMQAPRTAMAEGAAAPASPAPAPPAPPPSMVANAPGAGPSGLLAMNDASALVAQAKSVPDSPHSAAMLVYTAAITMAVYQVEPSLDGVDRIARDEGGYLSVRQDTSITVRVPRDRFDDAIARVEKLGDVTHRDIKAQDVTDEYVDLQARLKNAYAVRDRLNDLLTHAAVKEAIDIEKELGRVTEDIERMEGRMKLLRDQIAFSTITVSFTPLAPDRVRESSMLDAFPWLQNLGLGSLLNVH